MHDIVFRAALVLLAVAVPAWIVLSLGTVLGRVAYDRRTGDGTPRPLTEREARRLNPAALRLFLGSVGHDEERQPQGFSPPQRPAASYVHRAPTTAPTLDTAFGSHAASSPVASP